MDINTLQYVVGAAKADAPATIRFFGTVTEENTSRFNDEFDFLEKRYALHMIEQDILSETMIERSFLDERMKRIYLRSYKERLQRFLQSDQYSAGKEVETISERK